MHVFLTSALIEGEWSVSRLGRFTPRERGPSTHWIGDWVGPRYGGEARNEYIDINKINTKRLNKDTLFSPKNVSFNNHVYEVSGVYPASYRLGISDSFLGSKSAEE
jgi:hypothetical protein